MNYIFEYWAAVNIIGFVMFGYDKFLAKARQRRLPEATLMTISFIGGAVGCWLGMMFFRHKTRKLKFSFGLPVIIVLHAAIFVLYIIYVK